MKTLNIITKFLKIFTNSWHKKYGTVFKTAQKYYMHNAGYFFFKKRVKLLSMRSTVNSNSLLLHIKKSFWFPATFLRLAPENIKIQFYKKIVEDLSSNIGYYFLQNS